MPEVSDYGTAEIDPPGDVVAGSRGTWRLIYTAGSRPIQPGGRIRIYSDADTDRALPQFNDPSGPDYTSLTVPEGVHIDALVQPYKTVLLTIHGRPLTTGEGVVVTFGDQAHGSPGFRSQTFAEERHTYDVAVAPTADDELQPLLASPAQAIVGGDLERLVVIAPSTAVVGRRLRILIKAEDAWGNPAARFCGVVSLASETIELPTAEVSFSDAEAGIVWLEECRPITAGVTTIKATATDRQAASNPIDIAAEPRALDLLWGDFHGGQVESVAKIEDFFRYARDVAGIQFASYQRNDTVHSDAEYARQQQVEREFHEPGRFVAIPGYEWSPETKVGGHHNVYFRRFDQPMRRWTSANLDGHDTDADLPHVRDLHRAYRNTDTVITPHVGGHHSNLKWHDATIEPAVEITSDHGTFEWMLEEILQYDYRMGFFGGSDSHTGRPGADGPGHQHRRYAKSGLAAVYAEDVTIDALLDALKARRVYATTGARIQLRTEADGHLMGAECRITAAPTIAARVLGTAPLESVELFRGLERIYTEPIDPSPSPTRVRVVWEGASRKSSYSGVVWDGRLRVAGATMSPAQTLRFDSPRSHLFDEDSGGLSWHSVTCGYRSGFVFDVDSNDAELSLAVSTDVMAGPRYGGHGEGGALRIAYAPAERCASTVRVADLAAGPRVIELGTLNRRVTISLAPQPAEESCELTFTDEGCEPGINPYWVRVVQVDQEMAWSSPIYVERVRAHPGHV